MQFAGGDTVAPRYAGLRTSLVALGIAAASLSWTTPAGATVITKGPSSGTEVFGYYGANPDQTYGYGRWSAQIGTTPPFGTTSMDVERVGSDVVIQITTPFDIAAGDGPAQAADIAISTQSNGIYDLGIALGKQIEAQGLYAVSQWQTSRDIWTSQTGFVYGGEWTNDPSCLGSTDPSCGGATYTPTRIFSGTALANIVTVLQVGDLLTIDIQNLPLDQFSILWGTADCGNDTIAGEFDVPEPSSLGLFCFGIIGAGLAVRRQRKRAGHR